MTTTREVLDHHLTAFGEGDLDDLLSDFEADSVVVTHEETYRGLGDVSDFFEGLLAEFGQEGAELEVDRQVIQGDVAYLVWHGETPDNVYEFCTDTFVVRDGTIVTQTFAGVIEPR